MIAIKSITSVGSTEKKRNVPLTEDIKGKHKKYKPTIFILL